MKPLISVIVPVYNVEKYLRTALDSIAAQTYDQLEIIVVDDGSTDSSGAICDEYARKDTRFKVIHTRNSGPSAARNTALEKSSGEYLYFVDSDDFIAPQLCERSLAVLMEQQVDIVCFDGRLADEMGNPLPESVEKLQNRMLSRAQALNELACGNINSYVWNKLFHRSVFEDVRFPIGMLWEDVAVMHRLFLRAEKIYTLNEQFYFYRQRSSSIIGKMNVFSLECIFTAQKTRYFDLLESYPEICDRLFPLVALSCIRLHDRTLWESGNAEVLKEAHGFLSLNKERILSGTERSRYALYFKNVRLYNTLRKARHLAGNIVRAFKK